MFFAFFLIGAALSVASYAAQSSAAADAEAAQENQAHTQRLREENQLSSNKKSTAEAAIAQLKKNQLINASKGFTGNSPSFDAIQRDTEHRTDNALQDNTLAKAVSKLSYNERIKNMRSELSSEQTGLVFNLAGNILGSGMQASSASARHNQKSPLLEANSPKKAMNNKRVGSHNMGGF